MEKIRKLTPSPITGTKDKVEEAIRKLTGKTLDEFLADSLAEAAPAAADDL